MKSLLSILATLFISLQLCAQSPPPATGAIFHCEKSEPELKIVVINNDHYHIMSVDEQKNTLQQEANFSPDDINNITILKKSDSSEWNDIVSKFPEIESQITQIFKIELK